ncbi:MAG TPA: hypothetical protein VMW19_02485 [Myxococcota bacterium]|nr:hypothetical protein [Myxococcota bacterium]
MDVGAQAWERHATFPFTEDRRREAAIVRDAHGRRVAVAKGSPETLWSRCAKSELNLDLWRERVDAFAACAHKVVACARRSAPARAPASGRSW